MAVSDNQSKIDLVATIGDAAPDGPVLAPLGEMVDVDGPVPSPRPASRRLVIGIGTLLPGLVALAVGTGMVGAAQAGLRTAACFIALALLYIGLSNLGRHWRGERFDLALWLSALWIGAIVLAAIVANWIPFSEYKDISQTLTTPILLRPDLISAHPLGTDSQGLDILGGIVHGARVSLVVSIGATATGMVIGGGLGMAAGYFRGKVDTAAGLVVDSTLAFPPLILLLALASFLTPSVRNMTLVLAVLSVPLFVRISRANTMSFAQREFVLAARVLGVRDRRILLRDILPNVALPLVSYAFIVVGALIVAEASLSFLGLSIPRPEPTWGNMIAAGQEDIRENPHLVLIPSLALFFTVFSLNRVGERARQLWDPRSSRL
ncbi:ABC transporter permease [Rhodococcus sp. T2V]|uniref:ABC transporter permease n=1 Tax=Rhodococcus sp. T2V TaxID=3034164 RepID=UPI0023E2A402|nr:ABC transporter permease [Rhodococcus sp. T2V]MDF3312225.1 ABC transporter permease [Rhodococcus sp. T2V]